MKVQVRVDFQTRILDIEASNDEEAIFYAQKIMQDVPTLYGGIAHMTSCKTDTWYNYGIVKYPENPIPGMIDLDDVKDCTLGVDISGAGASSSRDDSIVEMLMQLEPKAEELSKLASNKSLELIMIKNLESVEVTEDEVANGLKVDLEFSVAEKYDEDVVLAFKQLAARKSSKDQTLIVGMDFGSKEDVYVLHSVGDTNYEGKLELKNYATPTPDVVVVPAPVTSSYALLYNPNNKYIGEITTIEQLLSVRNSIKDLGINGYYLALNDHSTIGIDKYGELERYPEGFFDEYLDLLLKLTDRPGPDKVSINPFGKDNLNKVDVDKVQNIVKLCENSNYPVISNKDVNFHCMDYPPFPTQESTSERVGLVEKLKDIATSIITPMKYDPEGIENVGMYISFNSAYSEEYYSIYPTLEAAEIDYQENINNEDVKSAGIAKIIKGTEPHWVGDN